MEFMKKVNEISKIVGKTASDTYNTVADKSGKFFEDTKMKLTVTDKEEEISKIYEAMGKTVYDAYKAGEDVGKAFSKEAKKVDKLNSEIADINTKLLYNKGLRNCVNCGDNIKVESTYCPNCGEKQKTIKFKDEKQEETKEEKEKLVEKVCPQCGLVSEPSVKFCTKCGYNFEK